MREKKAREMFVVNHVNEMNQGTDTCSARTGTQQAMRANQMFPIKVT